ncbi:MAG: hypothetical protein QXY83_05050 [Thermosphaera sp.]
MNGKVRLALVFFAKHSEPLMAWPAYDFRPATKIEQLSEESEEWARRLGGRVEFIVKRWVRDKGDLEYVKGLSEEFDGVVAYVLTTGLEYELFFRTVREMGKPTLVLTEPYYSLIWPRVSSLMREGLPVVGVSSSSREDFVKALKALYASIMLRRGVKTVVVSTPEEMNLESLHRSGIYVGDREANPEYYKRVREILNLEFIDYRDFLKAVDAVDGAEALRIARGLMEGAYHVRDGIIFEDVVKAVKMYLAAKRLIEEKGAQAFAINCFAILLRDIRTMPVTPCVAVTLLNDEGIPAACEADLNSLVMQIAFKYLADRPAWITDPVIDFSGEYVIYAHCTAPTQMCGFGSPPEPYALDTHDESGKPLVVRTKMKTGGEVTAAQLSLDFTNLFLHRGWIEDAPVIDLACRTKIKIKVKDAKKYLWEYGMPLHRVVIYGNWLNDLEILAKFLGIRTHIEVE